MKYNTFGNKEEEITRKICEIAIKSNIPLEINLNRIRMWRNKGETDITLIELADILELSKSTIYNYYKKI